MAKDPSTVTGMDNVTPGYLKGKIEDGSTEVGETLYNDIVQFFQKLMDDAGLSANGDYDNETNDYQFIEALKEYIKALRIITDDDNLFFNDRFTVVTPDANYTKSKVNEIIFITATVGEDTDITLGTGNFEGEECTVFMTVTGAGGWINIIGPSPTYELDGASFANSETKTWIYTNGAWEDKNNLPTANPSTAGIVEKATETERDNGTPDKYIDAELLQGALNERIISGTIASGGGSFTNTVGNTTGWTVQKLGGVTGNYEITHNLGTTDYNIVATIETGLTVEAAIVTVDKNANNITFYVHDENQTLIDRAVEFIIRK